MPNGSQDAQFREALANAESLYQGYLDTARLGDLADIACTWHEAFHWSVPRQEMLESPQNKPVS